MFEIALVVIVYYCPVFMVCWYLWSDDSPRRDNDKKHREWVCIAVILTTTFFDALRDVLWMHTTIHPGYPFDWWHWIKWFQFYPALILMWWYIKSWPIRISLVLGSWGLWKVAAILGRSMYG